MFNFLKKSFISPSTVNATLLQIHIISCWRESAKLAQTLLNQNPSLEKPDKIVFYWENALKIFHQKWSEAQALPEDTKAFLKQKCDWIYEYIYGDLSLPIGLGEFTQEELSRIGDFFAVTIVMGLDEAILCDAERAAIIYDYFPIDWYEHTRLKPEMYERWFFEKTGKQCVRRNCR